MVLDFLPYKVSKEPRKKIGWIRYITFAASLIFVAALFLTKAGNIEHIMFLAFIIGNIVYYGIGIALAYAFKDNVKTAMDDLRSPVDALEMLVDKSIWPVPSYADLIFAISVAALAFSSWFVKIGIAIAAKTAIMATTISNSASVNPL